jgi:23S rRNA pseudouridine2605 synthase
VPLARALSKLGLASRAQAVALILAGRVQVDGVAVADPGRLVVPERVSIAVDGRTAEPATALTIAFHKPRGMVTTRYDLRGRPTVFAAIAAAGRGLSPVGRLDLASSGLLLCTTDTQFAAWLTDPASAVEREYVVTVRGPVAPDDAARLVHGLVVDGERLRAARVDIRKASRRETHLVVTLTEGRNREIRRLFAVIGHEVTRLHRIRIGDVRLGALAPGAWRIISEESRRRAFPRYSGRRSRPPDRTPAARRPPTRGGSQ